MSAYARALGEPPACSVPVRAAASGAMCARHSCVSSGLCRAVHAAIQYSTVQLYTKWTNGRDPDRNRAPKSQHPISSVCRLPALQPVGQLLPGAETRFGQPCLHMSFHLLYQRRPLNVTSPSR